MSKIRVSIVALVILVLSLLPALVLAQASPPPCRFQGAVTIDGVVAPNGTVIGVVVNGSPVGLTTTVSGGQYKLDIPNIIPTTPPVTVSDGSHINFTVNGAMAAESGTWHSGIPNLGFNLTAIAAPPPAVGDAMISLSPDEGLLTTVSGTGFSPTTEVAFTWDGDAVVTVPATVTVESNGTFAAIVVAPAHVAGDYAIVVTDDTDRSAEATFTVITAEKGEAGAPGEQGMPGEQGQQGERGEPGEEGTAGSDAGNVIGIVAIILAVIAILLATVFRMRIRKLPTL